MKKTATKSRARKGKKAPAKKAARTLPVRGTRGHSAIDQQKGLREFIDAMLAETPRPTYDQMQDRLKATGFWISRSALARYGLEFEFQRGELRQLLEKAKLLRSEDPDDILALEDAITGVINTKFLEGLLEKDKKLSKEDLALAFAHARLQSSSAQRERVRLAVTRGVNSAVRLIRAELSELLKADGELLARVLTKLEQARQKLITGGAA